jgi:hypothetical protein
MRWLTQQEIEAIFSESPDLQAFVLRDLQSYFKHGLGICTAEVLPYAIGDSMSFQRLLDSLTPDDDKDAVHIRSWLQSLCELEEEFPGHGHPIETISEHVQSYEAWKAKAAIARVLEKARKPALDTFGREKGPES